MELERDIMVQYNFIDKVLNWGVILLTGLIIMIAWMIIRRRDTRIEELEDETEELEEEIDELEHAKKTARKILAEKQAKPPRKSTDTTVKKMEMNPPEGTVTTSEGVQDTGVPEKKPRTPRAKKPAVTPE